MNLVSAHACPMHDIAPVATDAAAAQPDESGNGHATHGAHGHEAESERATPPAGHDSRHDCRCISHCCTSAVSLHAIVPGVSFTTIVAKSVILPGRSQQEFMAAWVDFVLPFSTAPPADVVA